MNKKIYLILILSIIITTLSQTISFISGEHQFYETVQDKCVKCHGDIKVQLSASTEHSSFSCSNCHIKSATNHTNKNPECKYCHSVPQMNDTLEAHPDFASMNSEGCVACHTTYNVLVNYSRPEYLDFIISNNSGNWIISNIQTTGTVNLSYNALKKGGNHDVENVSCKDCHKDIFDAVSVGGHAVVLDKNGAQVPYHNNSNSTLEAWCRTCHNRNDSKFPTKQHSARKTTCEECHQAYNSTPHPGNLYTSIKTVPHLYRSLVCISCKSTGWPAPNAGIHFKIREEPYFEVTMEIISPLSIMDSSPAGDPVTPVGMSQTFSVSLNKSADITWYNSGSEIFRALSVTSSGYTISSPAAGVYDIVAVANDGYTTVSRNWRWNVTGNGSGGGGGGGGSGGSGGGGGGLGPNNIGGYVFDNYGSPLPGVLVLSGSYQNTTTGSGHYSINDLPSGAYNFSYSKAGFDAGYFEFTFNGAIVIKNMTIYDTTPPASIANTSITTGNFFINNSWVNPGDADFNYTLFNNSNGTILQNLSNTTTYLNLTLSPHYAQNISARTVDTYGNINQTRIWFNATIPDDAPVQLPIGNKTVNEGELLNFTVTATDADNDTLSYGTNATKGAINSTTGQFAWIPGYGDSGVYVWDFNSSDGFGGDASETITVTVNDVPLSIGSSSPVSDPITIAGTSQTFNVTLNRTADVTWFNNGSRVFTVLGVITSSYTNITAGIGIYNITAVANDGYDSIQSNWTWNVTSGSGSGGKGDGAGGSGGPGPNSLSGYVFDNHGSALQGVLAANGSIQNTTSASGHYSIANLSNGTYNFSYSKSGFGTGYFEFTLNGAAITNANKTLYDAAPPASISNPNTTTGNFFINNTWINPVDADFNHSWFRYDNGTSLLNATNTTNYVNLTWAPHYTQKISAQTVDTYGNINQTMVWFNATIPNNVPVQSLIGNRTVTAGNVVKFNVTATDADNDTVTYGTNATEGTLNTITGFYSWQTNGTDVGTYIWYFNSSDAYGGAASEEIIVTVASPLTPPAPANLSSMQGNFWVNYTWQAGAGNVTDSFNVSVNGSWLNGTADTHSNTTVGPHGWSNITIWAYNNTGIGSLSSSPASNNTQAANNVPVQSLAGNKTVDENQTLRFNVTARDEDNDTITYGTNASKGTFNTTTGEFAWAPDYGDAGVYVWYFNSSDGFGGVASETITVTVNNIPLSITSSSPVTDPASITGVSQTFGIVLNRTANITWYVNGSIEQSNLSAESSNYTNSTANIGSYNVTATANDGYDPVSRTWNWSVVTEPTYNVSGYVFDNFGSALPDVQVQNGSNLSKTVPSGDYLV